MKAFVLIEEKGNDGGGVFYKYVLSVHSTMEGAVKALQNRHDDIIEEVIGGDDNELSRISADDCKRNEDGILISCEIGTEDCVYYDIEIKEYEMVK